MSDVLADTPATMREAQTLDMAEERLVAVCMRAHRLVYRQRGFPAPVDDAITTEDQVGSSSSPTYGIFSAALETRAGLSRSPQDQYFDSLTATEKSSYSKVLLGGGATTSIRLPSGITMSYASKGCVASARQRLYGSTDAAALAMLVVQDLRNVAMRTTASDAVTADSLGAWQVCMRGRGYPFSSPVEAISRLHLMVAASKTRAALERDSSVEQSVAAADQQCELSSKLRERLRDHRESFLAGLDDHLKALLRSAERARDHALVQAATIGTSHR